MVSHLLYCHPVTVYIIPSVGCRRRQVGGGVDEGLTCKLLDGLLEVLSGIEVLSDVKVLSDIEVLLDVGTELNIELVNCVLN